ncbi:MAG: GAF domain-containing protein, partial [Bacteroidales bacterium]|nr:GAF domain-containing protein [Bacteroidales bacterium]
MIKQLQYNIAHASVISKNINELFDTITIELNRIIDAKNLFIALYNEETGMVHSPLFKDGKDEYSEWPAEKTATGFVIKRGETVLLKREDTLKLKEEGLIEIVGTPSEAWLGVPLKVGDKILGAIVVQNYDNPDVYDQTSIEIMQLVAHELSVFIDWQLSIEKATKLSRAVEQSSVSIMITNREGVIEYVNPFFTEL